MLERMTSRLVRRFKKTFDQGPRLDRLAHDDLPQSPEKRIKPKITYVVWAASGANRIRLRRSLWRSDLQSVAKMSPKLRWNREESSRPPSARGSGLGVSGDSTDWASACVSAGSAAERCVRHRVEDPAPVDGASGGWSRAARPDPKWRPRSPVSSRDSSGRLRGRCRPRRSEIPRGAMTCSFIGRSGGTVTRWRILGNVKGVSFG